MASRARSTTRRTTCIAIMNNKSNNKRRWGQRGPGKKYAEEESERTSVGNINTLSLMVNDYFLNGLNRPAAMGHVLEYLTHYSKNMDHESMVVAQGAGGGGGEEGYLVVGMGGEFVGEGGGEEEETAAQGEGGGGCGGGEVLANENPCAFCTMAHRSTTGGLGGTKSRGDDDEGVGFDDDVGISEDDEESEADWAGRAYTAKGVLVRDATFFARKYKLPQRLAKPVRLVTAFARRVPLIPVGLGALWLFIKDVYQLSMDDALAVDPDSLVRHFYMEGCVARASKCVAVAMRETLLQELYVMKHRGFGSEEAEKMICQLANTVQGFMKPAMVEGGGGGCLHVMANCAGDTCVLANTGVVPVSLQAEPFLSADMRLYVDAEQLGIRNYNLYAGRKNDFSMQPCFMTQKTLSLLRRPERKKKTTPATATKNTVTKKTRTKMVWHEHDDDDDEAAEMQSMFTNFLQTTKVSESDLAQSEEEEEEEEERRRQEEEEERKVRKREKAATRSRLKRQRVSLRVGQPEVWRKTLPSSQAQMKRDYDRRWLPVRVELSQLYTLHVATKDRIYPQLMEGLIDVEHCLFCTLSLHPVMRWCLLDLMHMARREAAKSEGVYDDDDDDDDGGGGAYEEAWEGDGAPPLLREGLSVDLPNLNVNAHQVSMVLERWLNKKYPPVGRLFGEWGLLPTAAEGPWHTGNETNATLRDELIRKLVSHGSANQKIMCSLTTRRLLWESEPFYKGQEEKVPLGPPYDCSAHLAAQGATLCISQDSVKSIPLLNSGLLNRLLTEHRLSPAWTTKLSVKLRTL